MNPLPLVWAELRRGAGGALAVALVIAVAVAMGVGVGAAERALRQGSARAADGFDLLVGAPGSQTQLVLTSVFLQESALPLMPGRVLADIAAQGGVSWWSPLAFGDSDRGRPIVGVAPAFIAHGGAAPLAEGRLFQSESEAVAGAATGLAPGATITPAHGHTDAAGPRGGETRHNTHRLTVVGRMAPTGTAWDNAILAPIESVWETHGLPSGHALGDPAIGPPWSAPDVAGVPAVVIRAASIADAYRLRAAYRVRGALRPDAPTMGVFPGEVLVELYATLGDVRDVMRAMAYATQFVVLLSVLVSALAILAGRRRQIATLRALGAPRLFVAASLWLEMAAVVMAGALVGIALGFGAAALVSAVAEARLGFRLPVSVGSEEVAMAALVALGGLALAIIPAMMAGRMPVAAVLRE